MARSSTTFADGNEGGPGKPEESSARALRLLQAERLQIEIDEKKGTLCTASDVRDTFAQFIRAVRLMLDGMVPTIAGDVATKMKLDAEGMADIAEVVSARVNLARKMIVEEWQRIGSENDATRQPDSAGPVAPGAGPREDAG